MTFHRLGLVNKNQMGFTLGELMLAFVISGVITGGVTMTMFQVFEGNIRASNHMTAVRQVQNAGYWVSHDAQMAQNVEVGAGSLFTLSWIGWEYDCGHPQHYTGIDTYDVWYTYDGASDKIWRHQKITTNKYDDDGHHVAGPIVSESSSFIAEHVTTTPAVAMNGNRLSVTITASVGEAEEERTYEIRPRVKP
jgi:type II secretory pathway pseudopilin PulG